MFYEIYLASLKKNIAEINRAVKSGVILSRLERFDYLFKKELASIEGLINRRNLLNRVVNSMSDCDYRIADFCAKGFRDIMETAKTGYTVKGVSKQYKSYIKMAESRYICTDTVVAHVVDLNGKITVTIATDSFEEVLHISNIEDYIKVSLRLISILISLEESDMGYKEWFSKYLFNEFSKVEEGVESEVFIERKPIAKDLKSYMVKDIKEKSQSVSSGKVIRLVK